MRDIVSKRKVDSICEKMPNIDFWYPVHIYSSPHIPAAVHRLIGTHTDTDT